MAANRVAQIPGGKRWEEVVEEYQDEKPISVLRKIGYLI